MRGLTIGLSILLVSCGGGGSDGGSPPSTPTPVNQAPTITSLTFAAVEGMDFSGVLVATDPEGSAVTFARIGDPTHGQVTSFTIAGAFTYRPVGDFIGSDTFRVRATDIANAETTATITINVANGDDDVPILRADIMQATGANPLVDVLANDEDPDGEALTLTLVGNPDFGSATVEDEKIRFHLPAGFKGFNRFQYRAVDGAGQGGVVNAVVFVDAQPSRIVYFMRSIATSSSTNVYIDDFVSTRKVTSIETTRPVDGLYPYSFIRDSIGRSLIVSYKLDLAYAAINGLEVIPLDGSFAARRLTPQPATSSPAAYLPVSAISPDGRWLVFRERRSGLPDRYLLADLSENGSTTEIALPAGSLAVLADSEVVFGPGSQNFYVSIEFEFPNFSRGSTIYRYSVANPSAAPQLVSQAAREEVWTHIVRLSPDEARMLVMDHRHGNPGMTLCIVPVENPAASITLSHAFGPQERISGFVHTNAAFSRVYYPTEDGVHPNYTFRLYGADTMIAGSGSLIATLPADDWRPEVWELSPDETSVLVSAPMLVSGQYFERASTLALTPGSQPHHVVAQPRWLRQYKFIDDGRFVVYGDTSSVYRVPTTGVPNPILVSSRSTSGFGLAVDGTYVATTFRDNQVSSPHNHLWLANMMSASGVQQVQITGIDDPTEFVSGWALVPLR